MFHTQQSFNRLLILFSFASLLLGITYNLGNLSFSVMVPNHLSSPNLISFHLPIVHWILFSKQPPFSSLLAIFLISLHQSDKSFFAPRFLISLQPPYLDSIISFYIPYFCVPNRQIHFSISAMLKILISITPSSPSSLNLHTFSHDTQAVLLSFLLQPQRNCL